VCVFLCSVCMHVCGSMSVHVFICCCTKLINNISMLLLFLFIVQTSIGPNIHEGGWLCRIKAQLFWPFDTTNNVASICCLLNKKAIPQHL